MLKKSSESIDSFHARLNALIKNQNTTQEWLCKRCEINLGTFRNRIVNKRLPDAFETYNIAEILQTSVEYLVTGEDKSGVPASVIALAEDIARLPAAYQEIIRDNVEKYKAICLRQEREGSRAIG